MRPSARAGLVFVVLAAAAANGVTASTGAAPVPGPAPARAIAVTIDDLPAPPAGVVDNSPAALAESTRRLLAALTARAVPAVGFVNEGKLELPGESSAERASRVAVLRQWVDAGLELGNHTYSHASLNKLPLEQFEADVVRGEPVTHELLAAKGLELRWFRHPFLQVGLELPKRRAFEAFLAERSYTVAPVTIDNDDYVFAAVYADALRRGETERAARVAAEFLDYMDGVFAFIEGVSRNLLEREPAQVLLLHANSLQADHLGELLDRIAARGYRFVPLEEALHDPAYARADDYVGAWGISWLHHWEITAGRKRSPSPDPPEWIQKAYDALPR